MPRGQNWDTLGIKLRQYRTAANMSLAEAAQALDLSPAVLSRLEYDKLIPSRGLLEKIVGVYGLREDERNMLRRSRFVTVQNNPSIRITDDVPRSENAKAEDELVFLCHSSGDKAQVRQLYERLTASGVHCWFDEFDLLPGQDWEYEITRAIRKSKFVLACLSKSSVTKSGYVQKELKKALDVAEEQPDGVAYLIPVRLEECEVPDRLSKWQWVNLFNDSGYGTLLRALKVAPAEVEREPVRRAGGERPALAYSSNDFNVKISASIRRIWFDSFAQETHWEQKLTRRDGGVDVSIRPQSNPHAEQVSFKTFPSPDATTTAELVEEALAGARRSAKS